MNRCCLVNVASVRGVVWCEMCFSDEVWHVKATIVCQYCVHMTTALPANPSHANKSRGQQSLRKMVDADLEAVRMWCE